jgi:hypothetical protein
MVKLAVLLLLAGLSGNAAADWIRVGENDSVNAYADPASIRVDRHFVKMSDLMDLQTSLHQNDQPYLSRADDIEYDCEQQRYRTLVFSIYSANMGGGKVLYTEALPGPWTPVPLGSIAESLFKLACSSI